KLSSRAISFAARIWACEHATPGGRGRPRDLDRRDTLRNTHAAIRHFRGGAGRPLQPELSIRRRKRELPARWHWTCLLSTGPTKVGQGRGGTAWTVMAAAR